MATRQSSSRKIKRSKILKQENIQGGENMRSMTGYAIIKENGGTPVSIEIKSYNSRYLELNITLPSFLDSLEPFLHALITKKAIRGKVDVIVKAYPSPKDINLTIDRDIACVYMKELKALSEELEIPFDIGMELLLKQSGVVKQELNTDIESWKKILSNVLEKCFKEFDKGRLIEGEALLKDMIKQAELIQDELIKIKKYSVQMDECFKDTVKMRFYEVLGEDGDDKRAMQEVAALLVRFTINEELVRLESHIGLLKEELSKDGPVGRRLDFICQEIMRETNTIGAKNQMKEITPSVISIKTAVENIREQVKNVE